MGAVAHEEQRDWRHEQSQYGHCDDRGSPAMVDNQLRQKRQEYELAGRCAGRKHSQRQAAVGVEPTLNDGGAENNGDDASTNTYEYAPKGKKLPRVFDCDRG